ncbi:MAG TPA: hypothetical protein VK150_08970, partial [Geothrix sp.]|nr:hypothetical protein [Geothrix sp.]
MTPALDPQIVRALTEEDAVERLAAVLDTAPPETDVLARYHWIQENAQLVQQLEAHILHVQKNPPEEKPKMTHQETLTAMVREIESLVTRAGNALDRASYLDLYQKQNNLRNKAKSFASKHDLEEPVFPAQPVNPFAKKKTPQPAVKIDVHPQPVAPLQESVVEREPEARPYQEPTPQDIAAMLNRPLAFADIDLQDRQLHVRVDLSSMLDGPRSEPPA